MSDPVSVPTWVIPAANAAIANRGLIKRVFDDAVNLVLGRRSNVVVTGTFGVGKTVLLDHLTGVAFSGDYRPPLESAAVERGKVEKIQDRRVGISVVPGQDSAPRAEALNDLFLSDRPVDGFVHVVADGFTELRSPLAAETLREQGIDTLEAYRTYQRAREVEDLRATLEVVRRSIVRHHKPTWMLVASTKADLYADELADAERRYSPAGIGPFVEVVHEFVYRVGADNFRWGSMPVCAWLDAFRWGEEVRESSLNTLTRNQMLLDFARTLRSYCGATMDDKTGERPDAERSYRPSTEDFEKLLKLAEDLQKERDRERLALDRYAQRSYLALSLVAGLAFVSTSLVAFFEPASPWFLIVPVAVTVAAAASLVPTLWSNSRRRDSARRELEASERALYETVQLLRETEDAFAKTWSTLDRAQFRIRLSRFDVGPDDVWYRRKASR